MWHKNPVLSCNGPFELVYFLSFLWPVSSLDRYPKKLSVSDITVGLISILWDTRTETPGGFPLNTRPPHYLQILDTLTEASVGNLFLCLHCFSVAFAQNSPYAKVTHVGAACSDTFDCWMRASLPFKLASLFLIMKDNFEFSGVCCRHYADMM